MKIAICTPHYGDVTAEFAFSLAKLVGRTGRTPVEFNGTVTIPEVEIFMRSSSVLPQLRNILVKEALVWGANFLLWIDADQKFPDNALLRLLSHNLPVVGANYPRRVYPHRPTAHSLAGDLVWTLEEDAKAGTVEQVFGLGFGFCLMDVTVFPALQRHAESLGRASIWPLFQVAMVEDGTEIVGEDVYFFRRLRDAEVPVYLDHPLSWSIGHVQQRVLTNADAARM